MYAMSVSPLSKEALDRISDTLYERLVSKPQAAASRNKKKVAIDAPVVEEKQERARETRTQIKAKETVATLSQFPVGSEVFEFKRFHVENGKSKRHLVLPLEKVLKVKDQFFTLMNTYKQLYRELRGVLVVRGDYELLAGKKVTRILKVISIFSNLGRLENLENAPDKHWPREEFDIHDDLNGLLIHLPDLAAPALWREGSKTLGFVGIQARGAGCYVFNCSRDFDTVVYQNISAMETLIDELGVSVSEDARRLVNQTYRRLSDSLE
jgi:hypothetical protein